jgi:hypothetical protein
MKDFYKNVLHDQMNAKATFDEFVEAYEQLKKDYKQIFKEMERYRMERNLAWEAVKKVAK